MLVWVIIVSIRDLNCDGYDILTELSLDVWLLVYYLLIVNILNTDDLVFEREIACCQKNRIYQIKLIKSNICSRYKISLSCRF